MEKRLSRLVEKLRAAADANLKAVVLYGSAATSEFHADHSDLNTLCLVERLEVDDLRKLSPVAVWWIRQGQPAPLFFTPEELARSADVFAIELLDMKASHRLLFGQDFLSGLQVPMNLHHLQVERELRVQLLRLRQAYLAVAENHKALLALLTRSISTFTSLFRHALVVLGRPAVQKKAEAVDRLAELLGFPASPFHAIWEVRAGQRKPDQLDLQSTFVGYLEAITRVTDSVDRHIDTRA